MVLLLVCTVYAAGAMTVYVDDTSGDNGATIDVPISVSSTENIGAMDISLTYDPAVITATGVADGELIADADLIANYTGASGVVNVSLASLDGINGTGAIAVIQFNVVGCGDVTSPLTFSRADAYDLDKPITDADGTVIGYEPMAVETTDATFTATGECDGNNTGDIDGSGGDPTMTDAVYLAKHVVGLSGYETISANGDIDASGDVTMSDAVYLAKHVVGLSGYETLYPE
ncbi:MAG: cohesin domain-containing protein [Euryarchaeota archaeon]|nr:cohesin domain-containing protein [Euryarchaeota archaeon]